MRRESLTDRCRRGAADRGARPRPAGASPLVQWLADRDALLAEKERELTRVENEQLLAQRRGEAATAALRDARDLLEEHDARITNAIRELDDLRSTLAERDALLTEKELELTRLENERLRALRGAEDATTALRESRELFDEHVKSIATSTRGLEELRSQLAERDRQLEEAERERSRLDEALEEERAAVADLQAGATSTVDAFDDGQRLPATCFLRLSRRAIDWWCPTSRVHDRMTRSMPRANRSSVVRVGRSPFPTDNRSCAYLQLRITAN